MPPGVSASAASTVLSLRPLLPPPPAYAPFTPSVTLALAPDVLPRLLARQLVGTIINTPRCGCTEEWVTTGWPSLPLQCRWFRVAPIDQDSRLLPPNGVWVVLIPNAADHP